MKNKITITFAILLIIILGLIYYIIFSKSNISTNQFDETSIRIEIAKKDSSIKYWENNANYWHLIADTLKIKSDSLESLKPKINQKYNDKIKFNSTATIPQLDSIIRAEW